MFAFSQSLPLWRELVASDSRVLQTKHRGDHVSGGWVVPAQKNYCCFIVTAKTIVHHRLLIRHWLASAARQCHLPSQGKAGVQRAPPCCNAYYLVVTGSRGRLSLQFIGGAASVMASAYVRIFPKPSLVREGGPRKWWMSSFGTKELLLFYCNCENYSSPQTTHLASLVKFSAKTRRQWLAPVARQCHLPSQGKAY